MNERIHKAIRELKAVVESGEAYEVGNKVAADLLAALPADLVAAATVEVPTEPGLYVGPGGTRGPVWRVEISGDTPFREGGRDYAIPADGPFRRLVAEGDGPTHVFTRDELNEAWIGDPGTVHRSFDTVARFVNTYTSKEA